MECRQSKLCDQLCSLACSNCEEGQQQIGAVWVKGQCWARRQEAVPGSYPLLPPFPAAMSSPLYYIHDRKSIMSKTACSPKNQSRFVAKETKRHPPILLERAEGKSCHLNTARQLTSSVLSEYKV
jgi:hypothetical protein